ncbi:MAG: methyl-accepting chemotaxis protein [Methylomonas sp.]|nr:methyl-accepting chemotaxis protein [Methylomonas sp.]
MSRTENNLDAAIQSGNTVFYGLPAAFGLCSGLIVNLLTGFNLIGLATTAVFTCTGLGMGWFLLSRQQQKLADLNEYWRRDENTKLNDINAYVMELERLFMQIVPILLRQVQTSRVHTEQEITVLTERFAGMADRLNGIISGTGHAEDGRGVDTLFSQSRTALTAVLQGLNQIQSVEHAVTEEVRQLSTHTHQLDAMAQEVRKVAEQINLLALNAAIEAARAGENGRGFAVVADEVRKLAGFSSSTGERISSAIEEINAAMASTLKMSETAGSRDDITIRNAEESIEKTLNDLQAVLNVFKSDAQMLRNSSQEIRDQIFSVLTAFQFQDRVSQMLSHVEKNLDNLHRTVEHNQHYGKERHADMINVDKTLAKMELNYTMPEELLDHSAALGVNAQVAKSDNDLTFF